MRIECGKDGIFRHTYIRLMDLEWIHIINDYGVNVFFNYIESQKLMKYYSLCRDLMFYNSDPTTYNYKERK